MKNLKSALFCAAFVLSVLSFNQASYSASFEYWSPSSGSMATGSGNHEDEEHIPERKKKEDDENKKYDAMAAKRKEGLPQDNTYAKANKGKVPDVPIEDGTSYTNSLLNNSRNTDRYQGYSSRGRTYTGSESQRYGSANVNRRYTQPKNWFQKMTGWR